MNKWKEVQEKLNIKEIECRGLEDGYVYFDYLKNGQLYSLAKKVFELDPKDTQIFVESMIKAAKSISKGENISRSEKMSKSKHL